MNLQHNSEPAHIQDTPLGWSTRESVFVAAVTLFTMVAVLVLFGEMSVSVGFLFWNLLVVVVFFLCLHFIRNFLVPATEREFTYAVFSISLGIRLLALFILYWIFYEITGSAFDVEAIDAFYYHDLGLEVSRQLSSEGRLDLYGLTGGRPGQFDDLGYGIFLGFIYYVFDNSIIIARIGQCTLDSVTVILIYKISKIVWEEKVARIAAILSMLFPMQILYTTLHLKESLMVFCLLVGIFSAYRLSKGIHISYLALLVCAAIGLASMRTALLIVFIAAVLLFFTFRRTKRLLQKTVLITVVSVSLVASLVYLGIGQEPLQKTMTLIGAEEDVRLGGRSLEQYAGRHSLAERLSLPILGVQGLSTPYPSMVRTNIVFFNQTMQWYQIGALFVWGYLVFFGIYGLYHSLRNRFNETLLLSSLLIGYTVALVISVYIMSIRYNIVKLVLFLPFIAVGLTHLPPKGLRLYRLYCFFFALIVLAWNFAKLYGRGYI